MIRLALCGVGTIGRVHLRTLRELRGVELVGAFDPGATDFEGAPRFESFEALLESECAGVIIAAPSQFHADLAVRALNAGKHVFLEKPLAGTLADSEIIVRAANSSHAALQVGFCERFNPAFIEAKRAVDAGAIGRVRAIYSSRTAPFHLGNAAWELGVLDTATHNFDLIGWLMGEAPTHVWARGAALYDAAPMPQSVASVMRLADGALAVDSVTWLHDGGHPLGTCARPRFEILGASGAIEVDLTARPTRVLSEQMYRAPDTILLGGPQYFGALKLQLEAFVASIEDGKARGCRADEALRAEKIALAAHHSLRLEREVALDELCELEARA